VRLPPAGRCSRRTTSRTTSWFRSSSGYGALGGVLLLLAFFLWAFTGRSTYSKNRFAIILSYCVIFLSLAGSLIIPTLLMLAVPELPEISGKVPVGLFVPDAGFDTTTQLGLILLQLRSRLQRHSDVAESAIFAFEREL